MNGKEMPLRLRLIEFGADIVAGGRSSSGGEAGSWCFFEADFGAVGRPSGLRGLDRSILWFHRLINGIEIPLQLRLIEFDADVVAGSRSSSGGEAGSRYLGEADFGVSGTPPVLRGLDRWVRWSHRLMNGKEMPLRLRLIEFDADVVAGGRVIGGGEAGS